MVAGLSSLGLFLAVADRSFAAGYLAPLLGLVWLPESDVTAGGGRWLVDAIFALVRRVPGAGPEMLVMLTAAVGALGIGLFAGALRRRGWPVSLAVTAASLLALHPVVLFLGATGQPAIFGIAAVSLVVLALDRAAAIGDAQSLMALGFAFALLFVTDPNALYVILPALAVLPTALRQMRDMGSAAALFLIVLIPSLVAVGAVLAGGFVVGATPGATLRHWFAVMHGSLAADVVTDTWLARNGGRFGEPLATLALECLVCVPPLAVVAARFLQGHLSRPPWAARAPIRPATAFLVIAVAPVSGSLAVFFWHPESLWNSAAVATAAVASWAATVGLRRLDRWLLTATIGGADLIAWMAPLLWTDPDKLAWRHALLGG